MTAQTVQTQGSTYVLVEVLRESTPASTVRRAPPDEWGREELLLRKLGPKGWGRVYHFQNYYASGWGEGGRVLSPKALDAFFRFVESVTFPGGKSRPSVFLTDRGGIELCWEDCSGKSVQVEFTGAGAEFYKAATDEEDFVPLGSLAQLPPRLSV